MIPREKIFNIQSENDFQNIALEVFNFQFENNPVYRSYCDLLYVHPSSVKSVTQIPFLPIEFFKTKNVLSSGDKPEVIFASSGTTGSVVSKHFVTDLKVYEESFTRAFEYFYGPVGEYVILGLLPSYLEREGSSLIYMVNHIIQKSKHPESGFYLNQLNELADKLTTLDNSEKKVLLIGVSFALLDLVEKHSFNLKNTLIMETGGMKGRRKELIRSELHNVLKKGFGVQAIHSEYGMTELLSQGYSKGNGVFECPPWMKVLTRDTEDPLSLVENQTGGINIIDLANVYSCSFIATQDLGKVDSNDSFEVLGRFDNSDIRGCNLMVF